MTGLVLNATAASMSAAAVAFLVLAVAPRTMPIVDLTGERGDRRRALLAGRSALVHLLPLIKVLAFRVSALELRALRPILDRRLREAGYPGGLDVDELLAATIASMFAFAAAAGVASSLTLFSVAPGVILGALFGAALPWFKVDDAAKRRVRSVCRELPRAIDMMSLAMRAGLDFPGALAGVTGRMKEGSPLREELAHMLYELTLGHSRALALTNLARRVPAPPVRQFVSAVVQSERQGTPLARVLEVQGAVMRTRRSQAAEQAAARAAVLILGPLMLIFACVFTILLGPFAIKWMRGDLF